MEELHADKHRALADSLSIYLFKIGAISLLLSFLLMIHPHRCPLPDITFPGRWDLFYSFVICFFQFFIRISGIKCKRIRPPYHLSAEKRIRPPIFLCRDSPTGQRMHPLPNFFKIPQKTSWHFSISCYNKKVLCEQRSQLNIWGSSRVAKGDRL